MSAVATKCSAPGCQDFGQWVFRWAVNGTEQVRRACTLHRDRGEAWLEKVKGVQAPDEATARETAPAQKSLF